MCAVTSVEKFTSRLYDADQKWDSIRRIPYSTPGRWVQQLDLSCLPFISQPEAFLLDSLLTRLFPLIPFLVQLALNPSFVLSRRATQALVKQDGSSNLRRLTGISYKPSLDSPMTDANDVLVQLLASCSSLEELEVVGPGLDSTDLETSAFTDEEIPLPATFKPLNLPRLHTMTLFSLHSSPLMFILIHSSLPALRKLRVTPYDDIPYPASLVSRLIAAHGSSLRSLLLETPKSWPTRSHPSPITLLHTCPDLSHLSLENPLPDLSMPSDDRATKPHPLRILSIPRPKADYWRTLEKYIPHLPNLTVVRARDVRWLRRGMTLHAQGAGVQGEMRDWRRRLARRGITVLDADWNECE